ncbi:peptidoglycan glycosyltransferase FtsW [Aestuariivirga litoralis]|uniref:FtsW/RodA/SpoVE family cell cycle protein n=1 Tax=Aestuariivirga litoralis TaxID=2650924 RepID=UPI0018C719C6|nr:cell division protein FtsW [Aestuariivirga litoralis]
MISRSDRGMLARWWFTIDRALLSSVLLLMAIGVLVSMAASPPVAERIGLDSFHFIKSQMVFLFLGFIGLMVVSFFDHAMVRRAGIAAFGAGIVLMLLALKMGPEIKGAHRWIYLGPLNLQPSELAKPGFVIVAAWFLSEFTKRPDMPGPAIAFGAAALFIGALVLQPDFGQTALVTLTFGAMLLVFGISWIWVFGLGAAIAFGGAISYVLVPHVASRIDRFLNPESGDTFQTETAVSAFNNGGWMGAGPGGGTAKMVLPDAHTDFAFAVVGEEYGLIACLGLMALFIFIIMRVLKRAKAGEDAFSSLAMTGLVSMFAFQACINMGVNVGLLPAKGMTLPFISYGGSSLLGTALAMGFVLALARRDHHTVAAREASGVAYA